MKKTLFETTETPRGVIIDFLNNEKENFLTLYYSDSFNSK